MFLIFHKVWPRDTYQQRFARMSQAAKRWLATNDCGQKTGTLRDASSGDMTKSFFHPADYDATGRCTLAGNFHGLYRVSEYTFEEIKALALEIGRDQLAYERKHLEICLDDQEASRAYRAGIQEMIDNLPSEPTLLLAKL